MRVLFVTPYPFNCAPSQRLKFEQYFSYFNRMGIKCITSPFMSEAFYRIVYERNLYFKKTSYTLLGYLRRIGTVFKSLRCDLVYLHLEAAPFGPPVFEYIFKFIINRPVIYDIDDVVFLPHASEVNKFVRFFRDKNKIFRIFEMSDRVVVVTNYLKERALKYNKNVVVISPTIDTEKYYVKNPYTNDKKIYIGWSGSRTTVTYLRSLENVLKVISKKYDVRLKVIGDADFRLAGMNNLQAQDWKLETEVQDLQEIDIGLYPLPKTEWILGKGGLKALQYMGLGIPAVCFRIGACLEFIRDGINGFLADSDEEWIEKLSLLIENPQLRQKVGLAGRKTVEENYSLKANAQKYLKVLQDTYNQKYNTTN